jgi:hypothetical protein
VFSPGAIDLANVSPDASLQTFEFVTLQKEFQRRGLGLSSLLALEYVRHGEDAAKESLIYAFNVAAGDAREKIDAHAAMDKLWLSLLTTDLTSGILLKGPAARDNLIMLKGSERQTVQRRTICVISSYTRLWHW